LHFGDLDFAGINIFRNEYHRELGNKARFLIAETSATTAKTWKPGVVC
jgi:hypothetical protein